MSDDKSDKQNGNPNSDVQNFIKMQEKARAYEEDRLRVVRKEAIGNIDKFMLETSNYLKALDGVTLPECFIVTLAKYMNALKHYYAEHKALGCDVCDFKVGIVCSVVLNKGDRSEDSETAKARARIVDARIAEAKQIVMAQIPDNTVVEADWNLYVKYIKLKVVHRINILSFSAQAIANGFKDFQALDESTKKAVAENIAECEAMLKNAVEATAAAEEQKRINIYDTSDNAEKNAKEIVAAAEKSVEDAGVTIKKAQAIRDTIESVNNSGADAVQETQASEEEPHEEEQSQADVTIIIEGPLKKTAEKGQEHEASKDLIEHEATDPSKNPPDQDEPHGNASEAAATDQPTVD